MNKALLYDKQEKRRQEREKAAASNPAFKTEEFADGKPTETATTTKVETTENIKEYTVL